MENSYWEFEDGLWYYVGDTSTRYKLDFENKVVIEQYNLMGEWKDENSVSFISFPPTLEDAKLCVEDEWRNELSERSFCDSIWAEYEDTMNKKREERDSWKEKLKGLISTKHLWNQMNEETDNWNIEEIVEIEKITDKETILKKLGIYTPYIEACKIKGENYFTYSKSECFDYEPKYISHYYVWQQTGYSGDDYSGYLLYPLKDGRYLKVSYSC